MYYDQPTFCCVHLEWGTKIIMAWELIVYAASIVGAVFGMILSGRGHHFPFLEHKLLYGLFVAMTVVGCVGIVILITFLYGLHKRSASLLRPWQVFAVPDLLMALAAVTIASMEVNQVREKYKGVMLFIIIFYCFWIICKCASIVIVHRYFNLLEAERLRQYNNTVNQETVQIPQRLQIGYEYSNQTHFVPPQNKHGYDHGTY